MCYLSFLSASALPRLFLTKQSASLQDVQKFTDFRIRSVSVPFLKDSDFEDVVWRSCTNGNCTHVT
jgi:hypothetical protein